MKKILQLIFLAIFVTGMTALLAHSCHVSGKGIITLKDYPHAVILCGEGMTINHGHYRDDEVDKLIELADKLCSKE